jgi:ABC-type antimicrobial peptide transport system permease subunit
MTTEISILMGILGFLLGFGITVGVGYYIMEKMNWL